MAAAIMQGEIRGDPQRAYTFDDVWAALMEDREQQKKSREDFDLQLKKSREDFDLQLKKSREDWERRYKETDRLISKLGSRFGELAEHLVAPNIIEKFNELGFDYTRCSVDMKIKESGNPNTAAEVDILLENGDIVIAVEVKAKPRHDDVDDHVQRMEVLRRSADRRGDTRRYQGAVAGAIISDSLRGYIHKQGFYLIEQTGDTVRINIPQGFIPREW